MTQDTKIVRAGIYPAVGVSRLGNSNEYFLGPEVYPETPKPAGFYRDDSGALKRQAARFRVYGYNAAGEVVRELTAADAEIKWTAHVANHKASWYEWILALDIPQAADIKCPRRNATVDDRASLAIDGGTVSIEGVNQGGEDSFCFQGQFMDTDVPLGRLATDDAGRLIFVPANGTSASPQGYPIFSNRPNAFINAEGWYDDACDGPVTAEVKVDGQAVPCDPAWVLSAPPDYAPDVASVRTLYDLLHSLFVEYGWMASPSEIHFYRDVYPILQRLAGLGWVNKGFEVQYGLAGPYPFDDADFVARLANKDSVNDELRRQVLNSFRVPEKPSADQLPWPWVYGDAMQVPAGNSPLQNATISETQFQILQSWAAGNFETDEPDQSGCLEEIELAQRPEMLTRAALEYCLADAFHPGCEVTWPIRHISMWESPFRLKHRPAGTEEPDYGPVLTQEIALSPDGPLHAQGPGDLTRWMGLPWQADTAYCRSGYDDKYDPYIPTFWPATVPNQVLTPWIYDEIMAAPTPEARFRAYSQRFPWVAPLASDGPNTSTAQQMENMVHHFGSMGALEERPGPKNDPDVPSRLFVATFGPGLPLPKDADAAEATKARLTKAHPAVHNDTGWASSEEAARAPLPVKVPKKKLK